MTRTDERAEFLADVVTTAVEGGIGYWSSVETYRWGYATLGHSDGREWQAGEQAYASAKVWEDDSDDVNPFDVDVETIAKALGKIREDRLCRLMNAEMRGRILLADRTNDAGEIDSLDADAILQVGIFGEVVYG